jgi:hypothetical protein
MHAYPFPPYDAIVVGFALYVAYNGKSVAVSGDAPAAEFMLTVIEAI